MKNNKGYTLVELLGAIALLAVISTIATVSMVSYLKHSKEKAYKVLSESIYEAYENCVIQNNCNIPEPGEPELVVDFSGIRSLVTMGYLDNIKNPAKSETDCTGGTIKISATANSNSNMAEYKKYQYKVKIECPGIKAEEYTWPDKKGE